MVLKKSVTIIVLLCFVFTVIVCGCLSEKMSYGKHVPSQINDSEKYGLSEMKAFQSENEMKRYFDSLKYYNNTFYANSYYSTYLDWTSSNPVSADSESFKNGRIPPHLSSVTDLEFKEPNEADIVRFGNHSVYYTPDLVYLSNERTQNKDGEPNETVYDLNYHTYQISISNPSGASVISDTSPSGDLYIKDGILITTDTVKITAYNIQNSQYPRKVWEKHLNGIFSSSYVYDDKFYTVVRQTDIGYPLVYMNETVDYNDVYYINAGDGYSRKADTVYYISQHNIQTGTREKFIAVVGQNSTSGGLSPFVGFDDGYFYMMNYYPLYEDYLDFIDRHGSEYFSNEFMHDFREIRDSSDLDPYSKESEIWEKIREYTDKMGEDERVSFEAGLRKGHNKYVTDLGKKYEQTVLIQLNLTDMALKTTSVPGRILDGYAADIQNGYFRVATTVGNSGLYNYSDRNNGVYIFDSQLKMVGSIDRLVPDDYISGARYSGDVLYLTLPKANSSRVVVNLNNPSMPVLDSNLSISGYAVYLQPISQNVVLGVNRTADDKTRLTLFNISNPSKPTELDSYILNGSMSLETYHTFGGYMYDSAKKMLIVPVSDRVCIFEVKENQLVLLKEDVHRNGTVVRAGFVGDYFYTFSDREIHILSCSDWKQVQTIKIEQPITYKT